MNHRRTRDPLALTEWRESLSGYAPRAIVKYSWYQLRRHPVICFQFQPCCCCWVSVQEVVRWSYHTTRQTQCSAVRYAYKYPLLRPKPKLPFFLCAFFFPSSCWILYCGVCLLAHTTYYYKDEQPKKERESELKGNCLIKGEFLSVCQSESPIIKAKATSTPSVDVMVLIDELW